MPFLWSCLLRRKEIWITSCFVVLDWWRVSAFLHSSRGTSFWEFVRKQTKKGFRWCACVWQSVHLCRLRNQSFVSHWPRDRRKRPQGNTACKNRRVISQLCPLGEGEDEETFTSAPIVFHWFPLTANYPWFASCIKRLRLYQAFQVISCVHDFKGATQIWISCRDFSLSYRCLLVELTGRVGSG